MAERGTVSAVSLRLRCPHQTWRPFVPAPIAYSRRLTPPVSSNGGSVCSSSAIRQLAYPAWVTSWSLRGPLSCRAVIATVGRRGLSRVTEGSNPLLNSRVYVHPSKGLMSYSWAADKLSVLILGWVPWSQGFLGGTSGKEPACQCRRLKRHGFDSRVGKVPWRRAGQPTPVFLPGESHEQRSLEGYSP